MIDGAVLTSLQLHPNFYLRFLHSVGCHMEPYELPALLKAPCACTICTVCFVKQNASDCRSCNSCDVRQAKGICWAAVSWLQWRTRRQSPHDFISIVLRLATGLALSSLEIQWHLSFFQQTNASQHEDWWRSHFKFSSCEGGKGSSKGKEARLCVSTAESLRTCDWCCHFLCKAPQQPKGSVGRLFLGSNRKNRAKTLVGQF